MKKCELETCFCCYDLCVYTSKKERRGRSVGWESAVAAPLLAYGRRREELACICAVHRARGGLG